MKAASQIRTRLAGLSLCGRLSLLTTAFALVAALGYGAWTGEDGAFWLAGAIILFAGVNALLELFAPALAAEQGEDKVERSHAR